MILVIVTNIFFKTSQTACSETATRAASFAVRSAMHLVRRAVDMKAILIPPTILEDEKSPLVLQLLALIEHQGSIIQQQAEQLQQLKDEIARLKNQPPRPKIGPSSLEKKKANQIVLRANGPVTKKRHKTAKLKIHKDRPIEPEHIPAGSQFRYYKPFSESISLCKV
jgi:hypothetical protein